MNVAFADQILQAIPEGLAVEDSAGYLVLANRALERILGCGPGELAGQYWTALIPEDVHKGVGSSASLVAPCAAQVQRQDGGVVPVLIDARPLVNEGKPVATLWLFTDRTEQERLEAQLRQSEKMAQLGQSISSVAHELNNPLTLILLQIRMLHTIAPLLPRFQDGLAKLQKEARRMVRVMDNLRAYARPTVCRAEPSDINEAIEHTLDSQMYQLQEEEIEVVTDLTSGLPLVAVDPYQLQQVFSNLISNAQQAISAARRPGQLVVTTSYLFGENGDKPRVQVRFKDNGTGIPTEVMAHIFEPFFTTKSAGQGTGLGLAVCERIVREHGGKIWAENNPEGGASLILELPLATANPD